MNYSNIYGRVLNKNSCGNFFKKSLRKTHLALNTLLLKSKVPFTKNSKKILVYVKGNINRGGLKKNLKDFIKNLKEQNKFKFKFKFINKKPHSFGMRLRKQKRK